MSYIAKVEINGTKVLISDSRYFPTGINAENVLMRDSSKKRMWRNKIKKMNEQEIANELKVDFRKMGLVLSSEVIDG